MIKLRFVFLFRMMKDVNLHEDRDLQICHGHITDSRLTQPNPSILNSGIGSSSSGSRVSHSSSSNNCSDTSHPIRSTDSSFSHPAPSNSTDVRLMQAQSLLSSGSRLSYTEPISDPRLQYPESAQNSESRLTHHDPSNPRIIPRSASLKPELNNSVQPPGGTNILQVNLNSESWIHPPPTNVEIHSDSPFISPPANPVICPPEFSDYNASNPASPASRYNINQSINQSDTRTTEIKPVNSLPFIVQNQPCSFTHPEKWSIQPNPSQDARRHSQKISKIHSETIRRHSNYENLNQKTDSNSLKSSFNHLNLKFDQPQLSDGENQLKSNQEGVKIKTSLESNLSNRSHNNVFISQEKFPQNYRFELKDIHDIKENTESTILSSPHTEPSRHHCHSHHHHLTQVQHHPIPTPQTGYLEHKSSSPKLNLEQGSWHKLDLVHNSSSCKKDLEQGSWHKQDLELGSWHKLDLEQESRSKLDLEQESRSKLDLEHNLSRSKLDLEQGSRSKLNLEQESRYNLDLEQGSRSKLDLDLESEENQTLERTETRVCSSLQLGRRKNSGHSIIF